MMQRPHTHSHIHYARTHSRMRGVVPVGILRGGWVSDKDRKMDEYRAPTRNKKRMENRN